MFFYLAGSIEYSPDLGKGWRAEIAPALKALGHETYDPAEDEMKNLTEAEAREFRTWKQSDLQRFRRTIQKIIAYDLDLIEHRADAIVCRCGGAVHYHAAENRMTAATLGDVDVDAEQDQRPQQDRDDGRRDALDRPDVGELVLQVMPGEELTEPPFDS